MSEHRPAGIIITAMAVLVSAGAFWDGIYAPAQQLALTAAVAAAAVVLRAVSPRPPEVLVTGSEAVALALFGIGAMASLFNLAAPGIGAHGPVIVSGWLAAFWLGRQGSSAGGARLLNRFWSALAPLMAFAGVALLSYLPPHHSGRLASFLGYPIAVGILGLLGLAGAMPLLAERRWWAPALACGAAQAVFLSGSRGVWAAGVLMVAYLLWAAPGFARQLAWPAAAGFAGALWAGPSVAAVSPVFASAAFLLACLTATGLAWFQQRSPRPGTAAMGMAALAGAAAAPGWNWFLSRAGAIPLTEGSSVERLAFLRDSLALAVRLPVGAGYRAWTGLHLQAASYGYYSAEVHSSLMDLALGFGWAGAAGFVILLAGLLWYLRKGRSLEPEQLAALAGLGALGLHSLADWELSYGLFAVPFWFGLGLAETSPDSVRLRLPPGAGAAVAGLALAGAVLLGAGDLLTEASGRAFEAGRQDLARRHGAAAVAVNPWNDQAHAALGRSLAAAGDREAALAAYGLARQLNAYEPWYAELQAAEFTAARRWPEAGQAWADVTRLWPWHGPAYETALEALMDLAARAALAGDVRTAEAVSEAGRAILALLDRQKSREPPGMPRQPLPVETPVIERARQFFRA